MPPSLPRRCAVLVALMIFQSASSSILHHYAQLIDDHFVITLFLTMLVGAGGNAGNQSTVLVIRGLATGAVSRANFFAVLRREIGTGLALGLVMSVVAYVRVISFHDALSAAAIASALFVIVAVSTIVGTLLPFLFHGMGLDPAHAGPTIQVIMDITGVLLTCTVCTVFFSQVETQSTVSSKISL
eukprot:m.26120 g.26120  ORF g.26120 m.26120 type:complete len:185 (-) comp11473_c0_seq1:140-694(-)